MNFEIICIRLHVTTGDLKDRIAVLNLNGKPIDPFKAPLWQRVGSDDPTVNPAAFLIYREAKPPPQLKVTLHVKGAGEGRYNLKCYYGSDKDPGDKDPYFEGSFELQDKCKQDVDVSILSRSRNFQAVWGDFTWIIEPVAPGPGAEPHKRSHTTCLELYWLYHGIDYTVFRKGIVVEILRYLRFFYLTPTAASIQAHKNEISRPVSEPEAEKAIIGCMTKAHFYRNPPRYDTWQGANHFAETCLVSDKKIWKYGNITLNNGHGNVIVLLDEYIQAIGDHHTLCNCEDQAAILRVYLQALGTAGARICFMRPFGFLSNINLVGRGMCNNPFFKGENRDRIIDPESCERTQFSNHYFCRLEKKRVLDSCAGPHTGSGDIEDYVSAAVDYISPTGKDPHDQRFTISEYDRVVTGLDYMLEYRDAKPDGRPHRETFMKEIGIDAGGLQGDIQKFVVRSWPDPRRCRHLGKGWEMLYEKVIAGDKETLKTWKLRRRGESIQVKIYVSSVGKAKGLFNLFIDKGSKSSHHKLPYQKGPPYLGKFSARSIDRHYSRHFWLSRGKRESILNVLFDVTCAYVDPKIEKGLLKWLNRLTRCHRYGKACLDKRLSQVDDIIVKVTKVPTGTPGNKSIIIEHNHIKPLEVTVGDRVKFTYTRRGPIFLDFIFIYQDFEPVESCLRLLRLKEKTLEFIVLGVPGQQSPETLRLAAVNKNTLLGKTTDFTIRGK